jgi:hypothetical protein
MRRWTRHLRFSRTTALLGRQGRSSTEQYVDECILSHGEHHRERSKTSTNMNIEIILHVLQISALFSSCCQ